MNEITVKGDYKFQIEQKVIYRGTTYIVKHRYTERFKRNKVAAIPRYVIWEYDTNHLETVSENVLKPTKT